MIKALVLEVIKKIHLIITLALLIVLSYAIVNLLLYEAFEKVNIIVMDVSYNTSKDILELPYVVQYKSLDGMYNGEFKSLYTYEFGKTSDGSKVFEVRHNINDIVDDSHITVSCRIILPLSILCFVMSVVRLVATTLYKRASKKNYLAVWDCLADVTQNSN